MFFLPQLIHKKKMEIATIQTDSSKKNRCSQFHPNHLFLSSLLCNNLKFSLLPKHILLNKPNINSSLHCKRKERKLSNPEKYLTMPVDENQMRSIRQPDDSGSHISTIPICNRVEKICVLKPRHQKHRLLDPL